MPLITLNELQRRQRQSELDRSRQELINLEAQLANDFQPLRRRMTYLDTRIRQLEVILESNQEWVGPRHRGERKA